MVCNANSASAALNKWIKVTVGNGNVVHGLRHSLRDRLRAVECPSDIIDAIGGWTTTGIGHAYGNGYSVEVLALLVDEEDVKRGLEVHSVRHLTC